MKGGYRNIVWCVKQNEECVKKTRCVSYACLAVSVGVKRERQGRLCYRRYDWDEWSAHAPRFPVVAMAVIQSPGGPFHQNDRPADSNRCDYDGIPLAACAFMTVGWSPDIDIGIKDYDNDTAWQDFPPPSGRDPPLVRV